jgi:gag-polyprotein putative aspartyl protease
MKTLFLATALLGGAAIPALASEEGRCVAKQDANYYGHLTADRHAQNVAECHTFFGSTPDIPRSSAAIAARAREEGPCVTQQDAPYHSALTATDHARNVAWCHALYGPDSDFPTDPMAIAPYSAPFTDHVPIILMPNRAAYVEVSLGGISETMLIDTGASSGLIRQWFADWLLRKHKAIEGPDMDITYADGRTAQGRSIVVNDFVIGGHTLHNVQFGVENDDVEQLLGFDTLSRVSGKFAINVANSTLDFE